MAYDSIVEHPTLNKFLKFVDNSNGREKILRLLQYLVRLINYHLSQRTNISINSIQVLSNLQGLFNISRKPLRIFKNINFTKQFIHLYQDELKDSVFKDIKLLELLNYSIYFSLDSIQWLKQLGILKNKNGQFVLKIDKYCSFFWFLGLVFGVLNNLRNLNIQYRQRRELIEANKLGGSNETTNDGGKDPLEDDNKLISENQVLVKKTRRELIKNLLDLIIASNGFQLIKVNNGVVGLSGVITSIIGIQDLWTVAK